MSIKDYSTNPDANTDISGINIAEQCFASNINNAIRQLMADIAVSFDPATPESIFNTANTWSAKQSFNGGAAFGDANFTAFMSGQSANLYFDTNDNMYFDRALSTLGFVIDGVQQMFLTPGGLHIGDSNFVLAGGTYPSIKFDADDMIYFDRVTQGYGIQTNGVNLMTIHSAGVSVVPPLNLAVPLAVGSGGTGANNAAQARINLGISASGQALGTAALYNIGTSGATVPLLDGGNVWAHGNRFAEGAAFFDGSFYINAESSRAFFNFDSFDWYQYDKVSDRHEMWINGGRVFGIDSAWAYLNGGIQAAGDFYAHSFRIGGGSLYAMYTDASLNPYLSYDDADYWFFNRATNELLFTLANVAKLRIANDKITIFNPSNTKNPLFIEGAASLSLGYDGGYASIHATNAAWNAWAPLKLNGDYIVGCVRDVEHFRMDIGRAFIEYPNSGDDSAVLIVQAQTGCVRMGAVAGWSMVQATNTPFGGFNPIKVEGSAVGLSVNGILRVYSDTSITRIENISRDSPDILLVRGQTATVRMGSQGGVAMVQGFDVGGFTNLLPLKVEGKYVTLGTEYGPMLDMGYRTVVFTRDQTDGFVLSGSTKGVRMGTNASGSAIEGVENSGGTSYQPLTLGGSILGLSTFGTERARVTAGGAFKASVSGNYTMAGNTTHEFNSNVPSDYIMYLVNQDGSGNPNYGLKVYYQYRAPNDAGNFMLSCSDSATVRFEVKSNGGIANYAANNVNLSDERMKKDITAYDETELNALAAAFMGIKWSKFKYTDQTHDRFNYGYIAQDIENVFPDLVEELDTGTGVDLPDKPKEIVMRKGVRSANLENIGLALLARALKRIDALERKLNERRA